MIHTDGRRTIADNTPRDFTPKPDLVSQIMDYESGELSDEDTVSLFQRLIDSGMAWRLQGSYGRMAQALIESGACLGRSS
jgi:hypothetical protein